ncbi:hypothetical protein JAAARDRAFT_84454, partial [Jaapia argillacea MUCL 33604]
LCIQIELIRRNRTTTTEALVDSGATRNLISYKYAVKKQMNLQKLPTRIPVHNVDDSENENREIRYYIELGENVILRSDWLLEHNPEIDWQTYTLNLSQCLDTC